MPLWRSLLASSLLAASLSTAPAVQAQLPDTTRLLAKPAPEALLTLPDAIAQARFSSPVLRRAAAELDPARVAVRNAWGQLLPSAGVSGGIGFVGSGEQVFGGTIFQQPSALTSNYQAGFDWQLGGPQIYNMSISRANQRFAERSLERVEVALDADVATAYLTGLQATANAEVARQQFRRNIQFLEIAQARQKVGQTSLFDVRQAEVTLNNAEVDLLRADQAEVDAKLDLYVRIGVAPPVPVERVSLVDTLALEHPVYDEESLAREAMEANPELRAQQEAVNSARGSVKSARSTFFPTLSASAGWAGFTQEFSNVDGKLADITQQSQAGAAACADDNVIRSSVGLSTVPNCNLAFGLNPSGTALLPFVQQELVDANNVWPFDFTNQPFTTGLQVSIPIFQGFSRQLQVSQAKARLTQAEEDARALELQIRAAVTSRLTAVETTWRAIEVQDRSRTAARDQLRLAAERYRLGSGTALEVADALAAVTRADAAYINAVYDYHRATVALHATLGRPYR
jgi:outer membrane protein